MFVSKMSLSRRAFLRGAGATIALPLLDGMVPAFAQLRNSAARRRRRASTFADSGSAGTLQGQGHRAERAQQPGG